MDKTGPHPAVLLLACALAAPALAADEASPPTDDKVTQLEAVTVTAERDQRYTVEKTNAATKLSLTLRETPQSVTVITRERLDDQNLQSLREVLDNVGGIYSYAYDTERVVFTSRGFFIDNLLYDGVPAAINLSTDSIDETLDTELYERIEVIRGATGLLSGTGSPSASVNLVRKHADARALETALGVEYASWNDLRATADMSAPLTSDGDVRARVIGVYQDRDSYQNLYGNGKNIFYAVIDADLTPTTRLSLGYDYQDYNADSNTWGSFPLFLSDGSLANWSRSVTTAADWSFWDKRKQTLFAELRQQFDNGWALRSTVSYRRGDEDFALLYLDGFPDPVSGEGLTAYALRGDSETKQTSVDLYASGPFTAFGREHELLAGLAAARTRTAEGEVPFDSSTLPSTGNFFEWDGSFPRPDFGDLASIRDEDLRNQALYAAARLSLADPLTLIVGARYSKAERDSYYVYNADARFDFEHDKTIPYAGLVYDFSEEFSAFASYTSIFNLQNAREQNGRYLDPIDGKSVEIGIKGEHFNRHLNTALTLFRTQQDNVAAPLTDDEGNEVWVDGYDQRLQASYAIDGTRSRGFELEASGSPLAGWNLSFAWSRYLLDDADGNPIRTYIPRTLVRAFTSWNPRGALSKLTIGAGINWQSANTTMAYSPAGQTEFDQGSIALLSALARYQFTPNLSAQLNGDNLLDKKYLVLDEYSNLYYAAPSNFGVALRYQF